MEDVWPTTDMTDISWDFPTHRHFDLMQTLLNSMRVVEIHHYRGITFIKRDLISFLHWFNYTCPTSSNAIQSVTFLRIEALVILIAPFGTFGTFWNVINCGCTKEGCQRQLCSVSFKQPESPLHFCPEPRESMTEYLRLIIWLLHLHYKMRFMNQFSFNWSTRELSSKLYREWDTVQGFIYFINFHYKCIWRVCLQNVQRQRKFRKFV